MLDLIWSVMNICENFNTLKGWQLNASINHSLPVISEIMFPVTFVSCRWNPWKPWDSVYLGNFKPTKSHHKDLKDRKKKGRRQLSSRCRQRRKGGDLLQPPIHTCLPRIQALREINQPLLPDGSVHSRLWLCHHLWQTHIWLDWPSQPQPPPSSPLWRQRGGPASLFFVRVKKAESRRSGPIPHYWSMSHSGWSWT